MSTYQPCPVCGAIPTEYMGTAPERRDSTGKVTQPAREFVRVRITHDLDYHGAKDHPVTKHRRTTERSSNFGERDG